MKDTNNKQKKSRRDFLETGVAAAAGVAIGLAVGNKLPLGQTEAPETVTMLTADGQLVEVEKHCLPPMCGKPAAVSNHELLAWMENKKQ